MTINLLDEHLINKIAAGEVIERPASVVKELVDNALDAGASRIEISFTQGGMEIIEVEDNGQGIDEKELPQAFMRHATSKIASENDLYDITTMGFRGEALPSIASVSCLDIFTCRPDQTGVHACYEGGSLRSLEPASCPPGTRVRVRNLFYNTPARRKFLKSPVSEGNHIHELVSRYALAWPEVSFTLRSNRKTYFKTPGNGSIRDAAVAVYGAEFVKTLLDISYQGELFALQGMISPPETTRQNRRGQLFFVNRRPIRSSLLYRAIDVAYQGLLLSREYPIVILNISIPGNLVDVNVHPQKWEVRFADEKQVFSLIRQVIVDHLSRHDRSALAGIHQVSYTPPLSRPSNNQVDYETGELLLNETAGASLDYREPLPTFSVNNSKGFSSEARVLGQLMKTYILVEIEEGLWIIDQHAAHERILFNRLKQQNQHAMAGNELLFPVSLEISTRQVELLEREKETLEQIGFSFDRAGLSSLIIRRAPGQIKGQETQVLLDLIELLDNGNYKDFHEEAMISMACHKAIKAGDLQESLKCLPQV
jgi:DNA mismatch repair protein MutL